MKSISKIVKDLLILPDGVEPSPSPFLGGDATKLIFDNLRNVTLCALLAQVAHTVGNFGGSSETARYVAQGYGYAFMGLAAGLFLLNFLHGEYVLRWSPHFASLKPTKWFKMIEITYWFAYVAFAYPAFYFNFFGK